LSEYFALINPCKPYCLGLVELRLFYDALVQFRLFGLLYIWLNYIKQSFSFICMT